MYTWLTYMYMYNVMYMQLYGGQCSKWHSHSMQFHTQRICLLTHMCIFSTCNHILYIEQHYKEKENPEDELLTNIRVYSAQ